MLIAQISDTHILARAADHPAARQRAQCLRRCVADINRQRPDAVVFTGDTVQHGRPEEYAHLHELLAPLQPPLYPVPGNRDDSGALRRAFAHLPWLPRDGEWLHYAVEDHAVRLVAIDSTSPGERKGVFCPARPGVARHDIAWPARSTDPAVHPPSAVRHRRSLSRRLPPGRGRRRSRRCGAPSPAGRKAALRPRSLPVRTPLGRHAGERHAERRRRCPQGRRRDVGRGAPVYLLHRLRAAGGLISRPRLADAGA